MRPARRPGAQSPGQLGMGSASWQRAVIRGYEEMELRKQLGLPRR